uniref:protein-tyrosine-phosphatase n=1 Tax=Macrostomum lignano TaxID=282301 RepID=A0A1I8F2Q6_9PLAT
LKKDLLSGRLLCPYDTAVLLASYALQSELGDYNAEQHRDGYVGDFRFLPNQTPAFEKDDAEKTEMQVGVNASGVLCSAGRKRLHLYSWLSLLKISFKRKNFLLSVRDSTGSDPDSDFQPGEQPGMQVALANLRRASSRILSIAPRRHQRRNNPAPSSACWRLKISLFRSNRASSCRRVETPARPRLERGRLAISIILEQRPMVALINDDGASTSDGGFLPSRSAYSYATMPRKRGGGASGGGGAAIALKSQPPPHQQHRPGFRSSARQLSTSVAAAAAPASAAVQPPSFSRQGSLMQQPQAALAQHRSSVSTAAASAAAPPRFAPARTARRRTASERHQLCESLVTIRIKPTNLEFDSMLKAVTTRLAYSGFQGGAQYACRHKHPRLHEGDQVLYINGRDMGTHTHEQAVHFIKAAAEKHSGELVLVVRPAMYTDDGVGGEETEIGVGRAAQQQQQQQQIRAAASLDEKPGLSMTAARQPENVVKNRYRDISPYDATRVTLQDASITGTDYINASFVNMEIPLPSGIVNRYIAAQGPLANTCADFWLMCWEQSVSLRGRAKCHQYWPKLYECAEFAGLAVTCVSEQLAEDGAAAAPAVVAGSADDPAGICVREFILSRGGRERQVTQLQYSSWPDHGTPPRRIPSIRVQSSIAPFRPPGARWWCTARPGLAEPESSLPWRLAAGLLEAGLPVCPLEIVRRNARPARAMLIQTPSQFKFVCEAILHCYGQQQQQQQQRDSSSEPPAAASG